MKRYSSINADRTLYTLGGGNFFNEWLAITIYKYQYLFVPTFAVFRTIHNRDWRIGFNWLNFAISIRVKPPKEET